MRARRELACKRRDIVLFNVAIYSSLCGCDLVRLKVTDLVSSDRVRECVPVIRRKAEQPLQVERTENTHGSVKNWVGWQEMIGCAFMFLSRFRDRPDISTRHYGRLVRDRVAIGLKLSRSTCERKWRRVGAVCNTFLPGQHWGTRKRVFGISMVGGVLRGRSRPTFRTGRRVLGKVSGNRRDRSARACTRDLHGWPSPSRIPAAHMFTLPEAHPDGRHPAISPDLYSRPRWRSRS